MEYSLEKGDMLQYLLPKIINLFSKGSVKEYC